MSVPLDPITQWSSPSPTTPALSLFSLSDELLLAVIQNLDRHTDVPSTRLTCRKLNALTETFFFRNIALTLSEEIIDDKWQLKLRLMPPQISKTRQFTILNQRRHPGGYFYNGIICQPGSYRILRWNLLHSIALDANNEFSKAACLAGVQFYPKFAKFAKGQLTAFRWRHAIPLSLGNLTPIVYKQASTLQELEISMIQPPSADAVRKFQSAIKRKTFPNLRSFKYHGLSHTEPLPVNRPEKGGRFRMIRPLFEKTHTTLEELVLSQDHCIGQVGKTPMTLGRTMFDTLCRLDDLYIDPSKTTMNEQQSVTLNLKKLELGGFSVGNLFDEPDSPVVAPRVRIHLPTVRRLVLNNCFGLDNLLGILLVRKNEIKLTEFGVRISSEDEGSGDLSGTFQSLRDFLLCFRGLEILSVLVDAPAEGLRIGKDVLTHHASTLRAYSVATRDDDDGDDDDNTLRFISIPNDGVISKDEMSPGCLSVPLGLREYGTFLNKIVGGEYARLRHLSQFPDLRTVVIRNFPSLPPVLKGLGKDNKIQQFWRYPRDNVDFSSVTKVVETFAEQIALPFYALPESYYTAPQPGSVTVTIMSDDDDVIFDTAEEEKRIISELEQIAALHTAARDKVLGFNLRSPPSSPTPKSDLTRDVLKQKAEVDPGFKEVKRRVDDGTASLYENHAFENYEALVQVALGVKAPPSESKPKLNLLIIGDWTYRDQMNISGPRRWDPTAWSSSGGEDARYDDMLSHIDSDLDGNDRWNHKTYQLRHGFKKEFDISLLPVFFSVDWAVVLDKKKGRYRWSPKVTRLGQDTLEGQGALGDTKLLDFAWMT